MRKPLLLLFASLLLAILMGCGDAQTKDATVAKTPAPAEVSEIRIALVPSDDADEMLKQFDKLRAYLEKSLGKRVTVVKVTSYAACIEAMKKSRLEMAWFGPTSYVLAEQEAKAEAVVVPSDSKGVSSYYSVIIVPASSAAKTVADLKGKRFGLVETSSTSGGLIPSYLVKKESGETIEKFTNVSYLGNHDAVVNAVRQGAIDAGGTNNLTIERLLAEKKLKDSDFRILTKSDPLPQSPLAWRKDLPGDLKASIKKAIMESPKALGTYKIAGLGEVAGFREVSSSEYQLVRDIAKELGLTRERLLK